VAPVAPPTVPVPHDSNSNAHPMPESSRTHIPEVGLSTSANIESNKLDGSNGSHVEHNRDADSNGDADRRRRKRNSRSKESDRKRRRRRGSSSSQASERRRRREESSRDRGGRKR
jgi:hypothetical protein